MKARWRSRIAAVPWKRALPSVLCLLAGLHLLLIGAELPNAGVSGFAETDYLLIEAKAAFSTADLVARNLRVAGLRSLELPGGEVLAGEGLTLFIGADGNGWEAGTSIQAFEIGAGSNISLATDREEGRLSMAVEAEELRLGVIPPRGAEVRIDGTECPEGACDRVYQGPRPVYLSGGGSTPLEMIMDLAEEPRTITDRVAISAIWLWELERLPATVERRGAIKSGSLRFLVAPAQANPLERGAVVDLKPAGLVLRGLEVLGESIYLHLSGRVEEVSVEIGDAGHSLMPTRFDQLARNPHVRTGLGILSILLGGGLTLFKGSEPERSLPRKSPSEGSPSQEIPAGDLQSPPEEPHSQSASEEADSRPLDRNPGTPP